MISEGSCGTEDWSNDAENSNKYMDIYETIIIYCIFDQINAALVSIRDFLLIVSILAYDLYR